MNAKNILVEIAATVQTYIRLRGFTLGIPDIKALLEIVNECANRHEVGGYMKTSFMFCNDSIEKITFTLFKYGRCIELTKKG